MNNLEILLAELEKCKNTYAYGKNHLLDTIIDRTKELLADKIETEIVIGY